MLLSAATASSTLLLPPAARQQRLASLRRVLPPLDDASLDALVSRHPSLLTADLELLRERAARWPREDDYFEVVAAAPASVLLSSQQNTTRARRMGAALAQLERGHARLQTRLGPRASGRGAAAAAAAARGRAASPRFYSKSLRVLDAVAVRGHARVSDAALRVAADRLSRMLRLLPAAVLERLSRRGASVHVIGQRQMTTDLPEHRHLRGQRGLYADDALRKADSPRGAKERPPRPRHYFGLAEVQLTADERTRGYGGLHASCGEENLVAPDDDPRYGGRDVLTHEMAHTLMDYGFSPALRTAIDEAFEASVARRGLWQRPDGTPAYAATCSEEYFAELTMWLFGTHGEWVDAKRKLPAPGPFGLQVYDPAGFAFVGAIYSGAHPLLAHVPPPPPRLRPTAGDARSEEAPPQEQEVVEAVVEEEEDEDDEQAPTAAAKDDADGDVEWGAQAAEDADGGAVGGTADALADEVATEEEVEQEVVEEEEQEGAPGPCTLELDNTGGAEAVEVLWVDHEGEARPWGRIGAGEVLMQRTWAGHVWEARPAEGKPCRYQMPLQRSECDGWAAELTAVVGEDCFGSSGSVD